MSESKSTSCTSEYLIDSNLAEEAVECRRNGYVLTGKFLGQGAYAKVYLGQAIPEKIQSNFKLKRMSNQDKDLKVAIKIISTTSAPEVYITKFLPREVSTMNKCYMHRNVIQLYDIFASHKRIYLVLEYAECGDLLTYVNHCYARKSENNCLTEERAKSMFRDILAGIHFVHSRGVAHRDLKCENILLAKNKQLKLSDFGFAIQPTHNREMLKTHCGSYAYAPPEILKQQKYDGRLADLWSLGVILFAMVNGGLPFKESDAKAVLAAMKKPVYFRGCLTADCKDLIRGLLKTRPQKRLSLPEIYSHSWMRKSTSTRLADKKAVLESNDSVSGGDNPHIFPPKNEEEKSSYFDSPDKVLTYIKERIGQSVKCKRIPLKPNVNKDEEEREIRSIVEGLPKYINPPEATAAHPIPEKPPDHTPHLPKPKPTLAHSRKGVYNTGSNLNKTGFTKRGFAKTRLVEVQGAEMLVRGGTPNTALPQVPNNSVTMGSPTASQKDKSRKEHLHSSSDLSRKKLFKMRYEQKGTPCKPLKETALSQSKDRNSQRSVYQGGRKTVAHVTRKNRYTTSPNVVNINIENASTNFKKVSEANRKMLQKFSVFSSHFSPGYPRPGATSVPPKPISGRTANEYEALPSPKPAQVDSGVHKERISKKPKSRDSQTVKYNLTCSHTKRKGGGIKISQKMLSVLPEKEEEQQQPQQETYREVVLSPERIAEPQSGFRCNKPIPHNRRVKTRQRKCNSSKYAGPSIQPLTRQPNKPKREEPVYTSIYEKPGCAVAAWVGQQCANNYARTISPGDCPSRHNPNNMTYHESTDISGDAKPRNTKERGTGKLLYRRSQTNKNILGSISHSIHSPSFSYYKKSYTSSTRGQERNFLCHPNQERPSPPPKPVLRLSHLDEIKQKW